MKKFLFVSAISFLVVSCGAIQQGVSTSARDRQGQHAPQPTATMSPIPTATIDYQATASVAEATADAANRLMIEVTAAQDQRKHEELSWTASADQATIAAASLTMQADQATSAAYPTYAPLTMTAQVEQLVISKTQAADARTALAATQNAPTLVIAMTRANAQAKYAETSEKVDIGVRAAIGFAVFCLALLMLTGSILRLLNGIPLGPVEQEQEDQEEQPEEPKFISPIPLAKTETKDGTTWLRSQIPCTKEQLVMLADGIVNRGMTLSFNIWEGTPVHRSLQKIREEFQTHKLARNILHGNGRVDVTPEGEKFLRYVVEHGEPPPPFVCLPENG